MEYTITALSHDGRGITEVDGKKMFIFGAMPGEQVLIKTFRHKRKFKEGFASNIQNPHSERVPPKCQFFGNCGGCSLQHMSSRMQLSFKETMLREQLTHFGHTQAEIYLPPLQAKTYQYRHKARLGVRHVKKKHRVLVGFRELKNPSFLADISSCAILAPPIDEAISSLSELIASLSIPADIPQIEIAVADNLTALIIRHLKPLSDQDLSLLEAFQKDHFQIYLQSKGPDTIKPLNPNPSPLYYKLDGLKVFFQPQDFTQINASLNPLMVEKAMALLKLTPDDRVLDLFCGLGNFSLPIAKRARAVTGYEVSNEMVLRAEHNACENRLNNTEFRQADLTKEIDFLHNHGYDKCLLDPPRSGAKELMPALIANPFKSIVYVSCHSATFARDVGLLVEGGYQLKQVGIMDMFPHTAHFETIGLLEKS